MLNLFIILTLSVIFLPMLIMLQPLLSRAGQSWPELPSQEEHYISPPRVKFAPVAHPTYIQEGLNVTLCICDVCHPINLMMAPSKTRQTREVIPPPINMITVLPRAKTSPPPIPNMFGFDLSDVEVLHAVS